MLEKNNLLATCIGKAFLALLCKSSKARDMNSLFLKYFTKISFSLNIQTLKQSFHTQACLQEEKTKQGRGRRKDLTDQLCHWRHKLNSFWCLFICKQKHGRRDTGPCSGVSLLKPKCWTTSFLIFHSNSTANSSPREPTNLSLSAEKTGHLENAVTFLQGEELKGCSG